MNMISCVYIGDLDPAKVQHAIHMYVCEAKRKAQKPGESFECLVINLIINGDIIVELEGYPVHFNRNLNYYDSSHFDKYSSLSFKEIADNMRRNPDNLRLKKQ